MNSDKTLKMLTASVIIIGLSMVTILAFWAFKPEPQQAASETPLSAQEIKKDKFQAVFLTNGQVYFGKMEMFGDAYKLSNVYYFASEQNVSEGTDPRVKKLGDELHKPDDTLFIPKTQVLFWENLRSDSLQVR